MSAPYYPGITARFHLEKVEQVRATLTVTMPVKQWRDIAAQLSTEKYESWPLRAAICDLINQANSTFFHRTPDE